MDHDALNFDVLTPEQREAELRAFRQTAGSQLNASQAPHRIRWEGLTAANDNTPLALEAEPRTFMDERLKRPA